MQIESVFGGVSGRISDEEVLEAIETWESLQVVMWCREREQVMLLVGLSDSATA